MPDQDGTEASTSIPANAAEAQKKVDRSRTAADEAAKYVVQRYTTFILVTVYLAITIGSTTDLQLLLESPLPLPLFGVGLPIVGFYAVMPLFYLLLHGNLLLQLSLLAPKLADLQEAIGQLPQDQQAEQRRLIHPFAFSHMLLSTPGRQSVRVLLKLAVWTTIIVVPLLLLSWSQVRFLPYHSEWITRFHRVYVCADLFMLWLYWPRPLKTDQVPAQPSGFLRGLLPWKFRWVRRFMVGLSSGVVLFFSILVATIPGDADPVVGLSQWLHRNLVVQHETLVAEAPSPEMLAAYHHKGDDLDEAWLKHAKGLDLRDRDLRFADFTGSRLINANFQRADLRHAVLERADLRGAQFLDGNKEDAAGRINIWGSRKFNHAANLAHAVLISAKLQDQDLRGLDLREAELSYAELHGADLSRAQLHGANLFSARLHGANLSRAELHGAFLWRAQLHGANLSRAELYGATLPAAKLHGANLSRAELYGADLAIAQLHGVDLSRATIGQADFEGASVTRCDVRYLQFESLDRDDWDKLIAQVKESIPAGALRNRALERLRDARERETVFPDAYGESSNNLFGRLGEEEHGPRPGLDEAEYDTLLADYLANLACTNEHVARGVARRAWGYADSFRMEDPNRGKALAKRLLAKAGPDGCDAVNNLPADMLARLKEISGPADEAKPVKNAINPP